MTSETKQCTKCGEVKPATEEYFYANGQYLRGDCKACNDKKTKAYREANKEIILEQAKAYYESNRGTVLEQRKIYYEENKEVVSERKKVYYRTPKGKFRKIEQGARWRGINFSLPFELYESQLWGKPCHYCGCEIEVTGLDRKDNNKGYEVGNVVPCCWDCNTKKNTKPYEEFMVEIKKSIGVNDELKVL